MPVLQPFRRYVEIGRVALVNYGPQYGKLVVIVDVIDQNRALIDSPTIVRTQINFKRLSLTDIKIDISRNPLKKELKAAIDAADVHNKWDSSSWGRKLIVQKRRAALNDFDRFKVMVARIKVNIHSQPRSLTYGRNYCCLKNAVSSSPPNWLHPSAEEFVDQEGDVQAQEAKGLSSGFYNFGNHRWLQRRMELVEPDGAESVCKLQESLS